MAKKDKTARNIAEIKDLLDRLEAVDPTPENRVAIAGLVKSIRGRLEQFLGE